jgi:hypothetical protein
VTVKKKAPNSATRSATSDPQPAGINSVGVAGYKSMPEECQIEISPLTILCGANSSGKSSIMQPTLLLKQTLEAPYDAGALLLNGSNVKFTSSAQFLSRAKKPIPAGFSAFVGISPRSYVRLHFKRQKSGMAIEQMDYSNGDGAATVRAGMTASDVESLLDPATLSAFETLTRPKSGAPEFEWTILRNRCFLVPSLGLKGADSSSFGFDPTPSTPIGEHIRECIYLPGLRGNPERNYPVTAVGKTFPGPFQQYAASVIAQWQSEGNDAKLQALGSDLERLGLTSGVKAVSIADTQVELRVGRLPRKALAGGLVNIADVGLGVSQTLPVLVALHTAAPGQLVYLEQPEIHLHPRAQSELANTFAEAAMRGVRVVVETHSSLILLGVQTLVARGMLRANKVKLHWFSREADGVTQIRSADLSEDGSFGAWPEDFAEVSLESESEFLTASESLLMKQSRKSR